MNRSDKRKLKFFYRVCIILIIILLLFLFWYFAFSKKEQKDKTEVSVQNTTRTAQKPETKPSDSDKNETGPILVPNTGSDEAPTPSLTPVSNPGPETPEPTPTPTPEPEPEPIKYTIIFTYSDNESDVYYSEEKKYGETFNIDELDAPTRDGYIFLGWIDADDNTATGTVTIDSNMRYRATWRECRSLSTISSMQEMTPSVVENSLENETKQLIDTRDNKLYWVTKLKDGNIWMTQNLDLDLDSTVTLTPEDTNITENWTPAHSIISGGSNLNSTNWKKDNKTPYSFDPGDYYFDGTNYTSLNCNYLVTDCEHFATTPYELNGEHGHVGNFYNWSAAVASNDTSAMKNEGADAETSICPKGWRLPRGYQSANGNDFKNLNAAYNEDTGPDYPLIASPVFFTRSGQIMYSATMNNPSNNGYYWSSTILGDTLADNFYFYSGMVYTSNFGNRASGFNIRCVAL